MTSTLIFGGGQARGDDFGGAADPFCLRSLKEIAPPRMTERTIEHILHGTFKKDGMFVDGLSSWDGLKKFRKMLMERHGLTEEEAAHAVRLKGPKRSPDEPAQYEISRKYNAGEWKRRTLFPQTWDNYMILEAIDSVVRAPRESVLRPDGGRTLRGTYRGCELVIVTDGEKMIRQAYPEIPK